MSSDAKAKHIEQAMSKRYAKVARRLVVAERKLREFQSMRPKKQQQFGQSEAALLEAVGEAELQLQLLERELDGAEVKRARSVLRALRKIELPRGRFERSKAKKRFESKHAVKGRTVQGGAPGLGKKS